MNFSSNDVVSIYGRLRRENQNSNFVFLTLPEIMDFKNKANFNNSLLSFGKMINLLSFFLMAKLIKKYNYSKIAKVHRIPTLANVSYNVYLD